jgi:hypothetical protein
MKLLDNLIAATLELLKTTVNNLEKKLEGIWNNLIVFSRYRKNPKN